MWTLTCFYRCLSVHRGGGSVSVHAGRPPTRETPCQGDPPSRETPCQGDSPSRPTPRGEIGVDQVQAHSQGGNSGGSDPGPHPRGNSGGSDPGPHPRGNSGGSDPGPHPRGNSGGSGPDPSPKQLLLRAVRILLECILVAIKNRSRNRTMWTALNLSVLFISRVFYVLFSHLELARHYSFSLFDSSDNFSFLCFFREL